MKWLICLFILIMIVPTVSFSQELPKNASLNDSGNGWVCNRGYERFDKGCFKEKEAFTGSSSIGFWFSLGKLFGQNSQREFLHRITLDLEIDGKPYRISRKIWCRVSEHRKVIYRYPDYYAFGDKIHDGGAVIVNIPNMCMRRKWSSPKRREWEFEELADDFLPVVYLAKDARDPYAVEEYAVKWQYNASSSRLKFNGIKVEKVKNSWLSGGADRKDRYSGKRRSRSE